jgi:hypothetical protein
MELPPQTKLSLAPKIPSMVLRASRRNRSKGLGTTMKKSIVILSCVILSSVFTGLPAQDASAAFKFKRFQHCPDGLVSVKTCECRSTTSRHFEFCHAGLYCHTFDGTCHK